MYKLLIADDEQIVLDSIKYIVENNFQNIKVSGLARSGREAIEKSELERPDIIVIDIKMPGINGIDAISLIKEKYNLAKFIIISAYDKFDFAKEALSLNVTEYLLKPLSKSKIINSLDKVTKIIDSERKNRNKELELKEKMENLRPALENGLIYSIFFDTCLNRLESYEKVLNINFKYSYVMTLEFKNHEEKVFELSSKLQNLYTKIREQIIKYENIIVGPIMSNKIILVVPIKSDIDEYKNRLESIDMAKFILRDLENLTKNKIKIGIGNYYRRLYSMKNSYEESVKAIKNIKENDISHIRDILFEKKYNRLNLISIEKKIIENIQVGNVDETIDIYDEIFVRMKEHSLNFENIKMEVLELMVLFKRLAMDYNIYFLSNDNYINEILSISNLEDLKLWFREKMGTIAHEFKKLKENNLSAIIKKSLKYIDENYNKDISLEEISKYLSISPHYFSKLFKDETAHNFVEYVTSLKMKQAKILLEEGNLSVKEICFNIGYKDPNYFSRIFKKILGLSPSEYKEYIVNKKKV
ncbi:MAG: response regulator [Clostridiales bacterium]